MIEFNLKKYIDYVKNTIEYPIEDYYIEKDYVISLFLSTWQNLREQGKLASLEKLIFKGGTLLMRNYLFYPRISEDLDFTHQHCEHIRKMSQNKRIQTIRKLIIPLLKDIKTICDIAGFDFQTNRDNTTYITSYHHKAVYSLHMYYPSKITTVPIRIKIEVNFIEQLQYLTQVQTIGTLVSPTPTLASIGYTLKPIRLQTYALEEIVLEKYRALLTRDVPKQRDMYDLYLINNKGIDIFTITDKAIIKKIESGKLATSRLKKNLSKNCTSIVERGYLDSDDDISLLTLSPVDIPTYERFKKQLFKRLITICKK